MTRIPCEIRFCLHSDSLSTSLKPVPNLYMTITDRDLLFLHAELIDFVEEYLCLARQPLGRRLGRRAVRDHPAARDMDEGEHVLDLGPVLRPDLVGEEMTRPERVSVGFEVLVPCQPVLPRRRCCPHP